MTLIAILLNCVFSVSVFSIFSNHSWALALIIHSYKFWVIPKIQIASTSSGANSQNGIKGHFRLLCVFQSVSRTPGQRLLLMPLPLFPHKGSCLLHSQVDFLISGAAFLVIILCGWRTSISFFPLAVPICAPKAHQKGSLSLLFTLYVKLRALPCGLADLIDSEAKLRAINPCAGV